MQQRQSFSEVLEAIDALSLEDQEVLLDIVERRVNERTRQQLACDIQQARAEFAQGQCQSTSVESLMADILS